MGNLENSTLGKLHTLEENLKKRRDSPVTVSAFDDQTIDKLAGVLDCIISTDIFSGNGELKNWWSLIFKAIPVLKCIIETLKK